MQSDNNYSTGAGGYGTDNQTGMGGTGGYGGTGNQTGMGGTGGYGGMGNQGGMGMGNQTGMGAQQGAGNGDMLDKGVDYAERRTGHEQSHSTTEKISDAVRSGVKKMTGKDVPVKDKQYS